MTINKFYLIIISFYLIFLIPTVYIYLTHGNEEYLASQKSIEKGNDYKATKQIGEATLFLAIATGYIFVTGWMLYKPDSKITKLIIIFGTISVMILYFMRIYGIPLPGTDIIIRDLSTDWRDVVTKICQSIIIFLVTLLIGVNKRIPQQV